MSRVKRRIPLTQPVLTRRMIDAGVRALRDERFLRGRSVDEFEAKFARLAGARHAVALNNGTNALLFALQALGVGGGDRVLTTPASFIATANAVVLAGARPVFADIDPKAASLDPDRAEEVLAGSNGKIRALLPVHLYGYPARLDRFRRMASRYGVLLIEDACQAHGARFGGRAVGGWGAAAAFSFYPSKNMTVAGDGGMLTTNRSEVADYARSVRDGGRAPGKPYLHPIVGTTARLNTVNAAIGVEQLRLLPAWNRRRVRLARRYQRGLQGIPGLALPPGPSPDVDPVHHLYVVRTRRRGGLATFLARRGIETGVHYPIPIHRQPAYRSRVPASLSLPEADRWAREVLSLPLSPALREEDQDFVIESVRDFFRRGGNPG